MRVAPRDPGVGGRADPRRHYILEAGFERLHGVDFRKGCYVGQEVTARMKHKTELRKGLVQVEVEGARRRARRSRPRAAAAGTLFSQCGGLGIAHLRLDRAGGRMTAGAARVRYAQAARSSPSSRC